MNESHHGFACFGGTCTLHVMGEEADEAVREARQQLLEWHARFSRFEADSELVVLNTDHRTAVPVSDDMRAFVEAALSAAELSGGLVDPTLLAEIRDSGYERHAERPLALDLALRLVRRRDRARPHPSARWRSVAVQDGLVVRPPGVQLDSGGIAKGLFADLLGERLSNHASYAVDCAGDIRLGGAGSLPRAVRVESPFDRSVLHEFQLPAGGVATSGIGRRAWLDAQGRASHHLLDPGSGRPAFTGVVQATAIAPTAAEAEARAKAAVLDGPERAAQWLGQGGLVVFDDGSTQVLEPDVYAAARPGALASSS